MAELTNAQAALQAAATVYSGGRGISTARNILNLAEQFEAWLEAPGEMGREAAKSGRY